MKRCYKCEGTDPKCYECYKLKYPIKPKSDNRKTWLFEIWLALKRANSISLGEYQSTFLIKLEDGRQVQMTAALDIEIKRLFGDWRRK